MTAFLNGGGTGSASVVGTLPAVTTGNCSNYGPIGGACSPNGQPVSIDVGGIAVSPDPICTGGAWSVSSVNVCSLPPGPFVITATIGGGTPGSGSGTVTPGPGSTPFVAINALPAQVTSNNCSSYGPVDGVCNEPGQTVTLDFGGIVPSPQPVCSASYTWSVPSLNLCSLGNGPVTVTADMMDSSGNPAPQASQTTTVDQLPPAGPVTVTPSPASPSNDPSTDLLVDCGVDAAGGTAVVTTTPANGFSPLYGVPQTLDANGQVNMTTITWSDGTYTINLDCFDAPGNGPTSPSPAPTLTIDSTLPTVSINGPLPDVNLANCLSYGPISGNCSENGQTVIVDVGGVTPSPQPICSSNVWTVSALNLCALPQGPVVVTADTTDAAGNSAPQATLIGNVDTLAPTVTINTPVPDVNSTNCSNYGPVSGSCSEHGQVVTVDIGGIAPSPQPLCNSGSWVVSGLNVCALPNGPLALTADLTDSSGNPAVQATASATVDQLPPAGPVTVTPSPASPSNDPSTDLLVDCGVDAAGGTAVVTTTPANGFSPLYGVPQTLDANGQVNMTTITWSDGTYTINLDCFDAAGNGPTSPSPAPTLTIDSTPASVAINSPVPDVTASNCASWGVLTGTCSENGQTVTVDVGGVAPSPQPTCTANAWSVSGLNLCSLAQGPFAITADHDDALGNSAPQATATGTVDTILPTVDITAPVSASYVNASTVNAFQVTGTCSEVGENVVINPVSPTTMVGAPVTVLCAFGGTWTATLDFTGNSDGVLNISADHSDVIGNAAAQDTENFVLDTMPPTGPVSATPSPSSPTNDLNADLLIDCGLDAAGGTVVVTTTAANGFGPASVYGQPQTLDASGQVNLTTIVWVVGSYVLNVDCFDAAGNGPTSPSPAPTMVITNDLPPVANNDSSVTDNQTSVVLDISANDSDPNGNLDTASVSLVSSGTQPNPTTQGSCDDTTPGSPSLTFNPVAGFVGSAVCEYQICDTTTPTALCDTAMWTITVNSTCGAQVIPPFTYLGSDQSYTPSDASVTHIHVKAWGASGGVTYGYRGGPGGYSEALLPANLATSYMVVVGQGGHYSLPAHPSYGFGGHSYHASGIGAHSSGGGLSGIFTGATAVLDTDQARSLLIAGGGGSGGRNAAATAGGFGGSGGDTQYAGGESSMRGSYGYNRGGGGGGYAGGSGQTRYTSYGVQGNGGSSHAASTAMMSQLFFTPEFSDVPPMMTDADYMTGVGGTFGASAANGGNGLVVITEMCAGNDNDPFAAIDRASTAPNTNVTVDVSANDADVDGDLDPGSVAPLSSGQPPASEGQCVLGINPGEIEFQPASGFVGTSSCEYQICDTSGLRCDTAILEVEVAVQTYSFVDIDFGNYWEDGRNGICVNKSDGTVWCWGTRNYLHNGLTNGTPVQISELGTTSTKVFTSEANAFSIDGAGDLDGWGGYHAAAIAPGPIGRSIASPTANTYYPPGFVDFTPSPGKVVSMFGDHSYMISILDNNELFEWNTSSAPSFVESGVKTSVGFSGGLGESCIVKTDGTVKCRVNYTGTFTTVSGITNPKLLRTGPVNGFPHAGYQVVYAIDQNDDLYYWRQQSGPTTPWDTTPYNSFPTTPGLLLTGVSDIQIGFGHACALKTNQEVFCWGKNNNGQLGDGGTVDNFTPTQVPGLSNIKSVATGAKFSCALDGSTSELYCWGAQANLLTGMQTSPIKVSGSQVVRGAFATTTDVCFVAGNDLYCGGFHSGANIGSIKISY